MHPTPVQVEMIRINTEARHIALQVALLVPLLAALIGLVDSIFMVKLPEPEPANSAEGTILGG